MHFSLFKQQEGFNNGLKKDFGVLASRVVAMPEHLNPMGCVFGGALFSWMDLAGAVLVRKYAKHMVSVAAQNVEFLAPAYSGDVLSFYAKEIQLGNSSMSVELSAFASREEEILIAKALLVYVAVNDKGEKILLDK